MSRLTPSLHVLILGGTTEARRLAADLAARSGVRVTTSLAGRVTRPGSLVGEVRTGGFGGPEGWPPGCASSTWTPSSTRPTRSPRRSRRTRSAAARPPAPRR
ncbi:precorrin-6A/cobalt-precorrin-6A reductase [Streptomyces thinghirensis]|nr:precorrin-6A/cobalt-precorrin-6A reductase [Streptomyces thinghirensis]